MQNRWKHRWKLSPQYRKTHSINKSTPSKNWLKLVTNLLQTQASLMFQLHSGHIGLNKYLHWIKCAASPTCTNCNDSSAKTIQHFLFECVKYSQERHALQRSLHCHALNLAYLLSNSDTMIPLLKYIHTTRCLKQTFREVHSDT